MSYPLRGDEFQAMDRKELENLALSYATLLHFVEGRLQVPEQTKENILRLFPAFLEGMKGGTDLKMVDLLNPPTQGVKPTDQLTATLIRGDGRTLETKKIPFPASRPVAPTYKEETTPGATKDSWVQEKPQKELFLNDITPAPRRKRNTANRHTGPKYTKELVQKALEKHYSPYEAGVSLGMTDPNYIYQLVKKYGIKRNFKSLLDKK